MMENNTKPENNIFLLFPQSSAVKLGPYEVTSYIFSRPAFISQHVTSAGNKTSIII
jgi:hypothetical protein